MTSKLLAVAVASAALAIVGSAIGARPQAHASLRVAGVLPAVSAHDPLYGVGATAPNGVTVALPIYTWGPEATLSRGRPRLRPRGEADRWIAQTWLRILSTTDLKPTGTQMTLPDALLRPGEDPRSPPAASYSADGSTLAVSLAGGGQIEVLRMGRLEPNGIKLPLGSTAEALAVSPDGKRVVALEIGSSGRGTIAAYDTSSQKLEWDDAVPAGVPGHAAFSPDGTTLAWTRVGLGTGLLHGQNVPTVGPNLFVAAADTGKTQLKITTGGFADWVCFGPDARIYTAAGKPHDRSGKPGPQRDILVWDARSGARVATLSAPGRAVNGSIALSPGGKYIYADISKPWHFTWYDTETHDLEIALWDARSGQYLARSGELDSGGRIYFAVGLSAGTGGVLVSDGGSPTGQPLFVRLVTDPR